ncbi:MAG: ABC transporter ATP-binding protein [Thermoprotei archaeon]
MAASAVASGFLRIRVPVLVGSAVSALVSSGSASVLLRYSLLIVGVSTAAAVLQFVVTYGGQWLAQRVVYNIRKDIFDALQSKSFRFHDENSTGDLMARSTMDVEAVRRLISFGLPQLFTTTSLLGIAIYTLYGIGKTYLLVFLSIVPVLLAVTFLLAIKQEPHWDAIREKYGRMSKILQENIVGHRIVRSYTAEEEEARRFKQSTADYLESYSNVSKIRATLNPLLSLVVSLAIAGLFVFSGRVSGAASIGSLTAAIYIFLLILGPVRFYGQLVLFFENGMAGMKRIYEVLTARSEIVDDPNGLSAERIRGEVEFRNVSFSYKEKQILKNVSLHVKPGEVVGLVGESGSGKTTLVNLVPRFYDPSQGEVLVDGVNVKNYSVRSLRKIIGFVSQEAMLFTGTIAENITFGSPNASMAEIRAAAERAQIADFIESLPEGYQTIIGERGITLSGGQRQRIAIARALIVDPKILVLDDSTSSVDVETELRLQRALKAVIEGRTTFVISHRLSTLRLASRLYVFGDGEIVEQGNWQELTERKGVFYELFRNQLEGLAKVTAVGGE